jgi:hypothetical protein
MSYPTLYVVFGFVLVLGCNGLWQRTGGLVDECMESSFRMKRSDDYDKNTSKGECGGKCAKMIGENINSSSPDMRKAFEDMKKDPEMFMDFTKPQFEKFCKEIMNPALDCINECPNSTLTEILQKAFSSVNFICKKHYDEVYKNYDCLKKTHKDESEPCTRGKCKQYSTAMKTLINQTEYLIKHNETSKLKKLFSETCQFSSCMMQCCTPIMEKNCGKNVTHLMEVKLTHYTLKNDKQMLELLGHPDAFPEECEKVLKETEDKNKGKSNETSGKPSHHGTTPHHGTSFHHGTSNGYPVTTTGYKPT